MSKNSKMDRRTFIASSLSFTLGGCATGFGKKISLMDTKERTPAAVDLRGVSLSDDPWQIKTEYEAVVIGSGYGASVIAARLAGKFSSLCILERGKEWRAGDLPSSGSQLSKELLTDHNPLGLFDMRTSIGSDVDVISANGLGGTSLINAAIAIRPEPNVFSCREWPEEIRQAALDGSLETYYQRAESVLKPNKRLPFTQNAKAIHHQYISEKLGRKWGALNLNVRGGEFTAGSNEFGYPQSPCIQCGDCCTGCNYGAKNTLVTNYLSLAKKNGAEIYTRAEVLSIEKISSGYHINVLVRDEKEIRGVVIKTKWLFLGAGSRGSTEILLKSQNESMQFSETLGSRLSANGDVMGLAYNTLLKNNTIGMGGDLPHLNASNVPGPIITSYADFRNPSLERDVNSQFLLLDGVVPSGLSSIVAKALATYGLTQSSHFNEAQKKRISSDLTEAHPNGDGALRYSALYFACGHDSSGGRYTYSRYRKELSYRWKNVTHEPTFQRVNSVMKRFAESSGGIFVPNPRSTIFGHRIQATHPLGGCPMGESSQKGVVNHLGHVYNPRGGFHENLYVVDAAIIPRSLAATPLLTITALAERIADSIR